MKIPMRKIKSIRRPVRMSAFLLNVVWFLWKEKREMRRRRKEKGEYQSAGVHPCHSACRRGAYTYCQLPGVFTRIMSAMVIPLNTSRARYLSDCSMNDYFFLALYLSSARAKSLSSSSVSNMSSGIEDTFPSGPTATITKLAVNAGNLCSWPTSF